MTASAGNNPYAVLTANLGGPAGTPSAYSSGSSSLLVASGFHTLYGYTFSEVHGVGSAAVTLYDGATSAVTNQHFGEQHIGPNGTLTNWFPPNGITFTSGMCFVGLGGVASGYVSGAVFYQ